MSNILRGGIIGVITAAPLMALFGAFIGAYIELVVSAAKFGAPMSLRGVLQYWLIGLGVGALLGATVGVICGIILRRHFGLIVGASAGLSTLALGGGFLGAGLRGPNDPIDMAFTVKSALAGGVVGVVVGAGLGVVVDDILRRLGLGAA